MGWLSFFWPKGPWILVYMLQQMEYSSLKFLKWGFKLPNLFRVQKRKTLEKTARAKVSLIVAYLIWFLVIGSGIAVIFIFEIWAGLLVLALLPLALLLGLAIANHLLALLVVGPTEKREIAAAKQKLNGLNVVKIAVLGSYGKTSMKELLVTVLQEGKKAEATPGNKNVLISHARWLNSLSSDQEVLIFEYGEGEPGDIRKLADFSMPNYAVVTGLAPAHLDTYGSLEAVATDFETIQDFVDAGNIYVNNDSLGDFLTNSPHYSKNGTDKLKSEKIKVDFDGTSFEAVEGKHRFKVHTGLLGEHHVGPICAVIEIARRLGLSDERIQNGLAKVVPHEHRMQPRFLYGAWIIDDTYNGNIEGMKAGLELLKKLPAKRRIYVTPGLVDQGSETEKVHNELGSRIAQAHPDKVVLMRNSVTNYIKTGLEDGGYQGELQLEPDPLDFYTNLEHHLAAGDVVMLQNDWPDSYK